MLIFNTEVLIVCTYIQAAILVGDTSDLLLLDVALRRRAG